MMNGDPRNPHISADIRVVQIDGEPWFIAKDVASILGFDRPADAVKPLDDDEKMQVSPTTINDQPRPGFGPQTVTVVNESGLYSLVLRSRKPEAKPFRRWVTSEVLPTIRKTGGAYIAPGSQAELVTAYEWKRAAIVWAFTTDKATGRGNRTSSGALSARTFAGLAISGLSSQETVRKYRKAWALAIADGFATDVKPGDEIDLPDVEWQQGTA